MKNICLIPLRGGSKGIPRKNLKHLNGRPLCSYAISAAINSRSIQEVWVSSEDQEIIDYVMSEFPEVKIRKRPMEFASDTSTTESVILDLISSNEFNGHDQLVLVQATSPLLTSREIDRAIIQLRNSERKSLVSGVEFKRFLWSSDGLPLNYDLFNRPRRQDFKAAFLENGALYISNIDTIRRTHSRIDLPAELFYMSDDSSFEIDEFSDWIIIENLMKNRINE